MEAVSPFVVEEIEPHNDVLSSRDIVQSQSNDRHGKQSQSIDQHAKKSQHEQKSQHDEKGQHDEERSLMAPVSNIGHNEMMTQVMTEMLKFLKTLNDRFGMPIFEEGEFPISKKRKEVEEESSKKSKKRKKRDHLLLEEEDTLVYRYELVFISTFLMTNIGLKSVLMVDFNKAWVIIINIKELHKQLTRMMKKGEALSHFERRRTSKSGKSLRTFAIASIPDILKRHLDPLGNMNYKKAILKKWPGLSMQHVVIFSGEQWLTRWRELMSTNMHDVKRWRSDMNWEQEQEEEQEEIYLTEDERRGWLTCHKFIPNGLYCEDEPEDLDTNLPIQTPFSIDFGWHVVLQ
jgi:hypothetical protein